VPRPASRSTILPRNTPPTGRRFRTTLIPCGHHRPARRHRVADEDIAHAYERAITWVGLGDDPPRYLVAGPDRSGNLLELVVIEVRETALVIHAMALRPSTERELFGGEGR